MDTSKSPTTALPDPAKRLAMLEGRGLPGPRVRHCLLVGDLAGAMARWLAEAGCDLSPELALAGGVLHDLGKGRPGHDVVGARLLEDAGYPGLAAIAASHVDMEFEPGTNLTEAALVFLADKMCIGDRFVGVRERFEAKTSANVGDPKALAFFTRQSKCAEAILAEVEVRLGPGVEKRLAAMPPKTTRRK